MSDHPPSQESRADRPLRSPLAGSSLPTAPSASAASNRAPLQSVQVMRGLAALAVVLLHTNLILAQSEYGNRDVFQGAASRGWLGVTFFFVLSGFIIMRAHQRDIGRPSQLRRYAWRRFARVYPLYWVLLTVFVLAAEFGLGNPDYRSEVGDFLTAYLLIPVTAYPEIPLKVAWTLLFEVKFYLAFGLLLLSRRLGSVAFAVWVIAVICNGALDSSYDWGRLYPDAGFLSAWNLNFFFGMAVCLLLPRLSTRHALPLLAVGVVLLGALAVVLGADMDDVARSAPAMAAFAIAFSLILAGGVLWEHSWTGKAPRALTLLGDASYAVYLVHSAALSLLAQVGDRLLPTSVPDPLFFLACFVAATAAGIAVHLLIERPLLNSLRDRRDHARPRGNRVKAEQ